MEQQKPEEKKEVNQNQAWHNAVLTEKEKQRGRALFGLPLVLAMSLPGLSGCAPSETPEQKAIRIERQKEAVEKKTEEIRGLYPGMSKEEIERAATQAVEREARRNELLKGGDQAMENKDYVSAAKYYHSADATEKEKNAHLEAAKVAAEEGRFRDAVYHCEKLGQDTADTRAIYLKVADYQANGEHSYNIAAEYYIKAGEPEKAKEAYMNAGKYAESIHDDHLALMFYTKAAGELPKEKAIQFAEESAAQKNFQEAALFYKQAGDAINEQKMYKEILVREAKKYESYGYYSRAAEQYNKAGMKEEEKQMLIKEAKKDEGYGYYSSAAEQYNKAGMKEEEKQMLIKEAKKDENNGWYGSAFHVYHVAGMKDKEAEMVAKMEDSRQFTVNTVVKIEPIKWEVLVGPDGEAIDARMLTGVGVGAVVTGVAGVMLLGPFGALLAAPGAGAGGMVAGATGGNPQKQLATPIQKEGYIITFETGEKVRTFSSYDEGSRVPRHYLDIDENYVQPGQP